MSTEFPSLNPERTGRSDAEPGRERRGLLLPVSIVAGVVLIGLLWWALSPHGPRPPFLAFESPQLGCRFEYSSEMTAGPNFVRSASGSILTIERHSLVGAQKDWVAALPDVLFPQVMIQLRENYNDLVETGRRPITVDGRKGIEVVLSGHTRTSDPTTVITIVIFANDDWVYVLRTYSPARSDAADRPLLQRVRESWKFLGEGAARTSS